MSERNNGGPAFPQTRQQWQGSLGGGRYVTVDLTGGMSLRDWFAGQALVGIINACAMDTRERGEATENMFARKAYSIADAMLEARK